MLDWFRTSLSSGNCLEFQRRGEWVFVRDSYDPRGPQLKLSPGEIADMIGHAKAGTLDFLTRPVAE